MSKELIGILFCAFWFSLGWLMNDWLRSPSPTPPSTETAYYSDTSFSEDENCVKEKPSLRYTEFKDEKQSAGKTDVKQQADTSSLDKVQSVVDKFKQLINAEEYEQAVLHYSEFRHFSNASPLMKSILRNQLLTYSLNGDSSRFQALSQAWRESYYDDADVLMLTAKFYRESDLLGEGLSILHLALSYSHGHEKSRVRGALKEFVRDTDQMLVSENDWYRLQAFYENLLSTGVEDDEDRLRLAEIYLANGSESLGLEMLDPLVSKVSTQKQAETLLARYRDPDQEFTPQKRGNSSYGSRISMRRLGHQFILPLASRSGVEVDLLLDTGASSTLLTREAFERFSANRRYRYLGPRLFSTANGISQGETYRVTGVRFGPYKLKYVDISVTDNDFGSEFDGLLGMDILEKFAFQIDQNKSELVLNRRSR